MSSVNNVQSSPAVQSIVANPIQKSIKPDAAGSPQRATDRLELSGASHLLQTLKSQPGIRADKVADVKAQIASGTYETDHKLDGAIDKLLDDVNG